MATFFRPTSPFLCGIPLQSPLPLARFLPPYYQHTVTNYLKDILPAEQLHDGYILDPFGSSPLLTIELAKAGAAVIVCCNNPILRILIDVIALQPKKEEFQAILAEISTLRKLDTRIELFLRALYHSICNTCFSEIEVDTFIWEKDPLSGTYFLSAKQYHCPVCGSEGQFPVTIHDRQQLERLPPRPLLETQAASKIVNSNDSAYEAVNESLQVYTTRSLYAILTLLNKLDDLSLDQRQQKLLKGLLIQTFDLSNSLWPHPPRRHRPKQLSLPTQFQEFNFWKALDKSITAWAEYFQENTQEPVSTEEYPTLPRQGQISIFEGRLKDLLAHTFVKDFSAVVTTLPRPNQAFWTLCALWSGWLIGREKVKPLKSVFHRKRYDWGWHSRALSATFQQLSEDLSNHIPCFFLIEEHEPNFLAAALLAADYAGFRLENLTLRADQQRAQIQSRFSARITNALLISSGEQTKMLSKLQEHLASSVQHYLEQTLEPLSFSQIHAVALANGLRSTQIHSSQPYPLYSLLEIFPFQKVSDYPNFFLTILDKAIRSSSHLFPLTGEEKSLEASYWWLTKPPFDHKPLSDQVEKVLYDFLLATKTANFLEIDQSICNQINSIIAPSIGLIYECLRSYATVDPDTGQWTMREEEFPSNREQDLTEIRQHLILLGKRLDYRVEDVDPTIWFDDNSYEKTIWYVQSDATILNLLNALEMANNRIILAIPGSRVNLILYKIQPYPFLRKLIENQSPIVRFRQIRWMVTQPQINRRLFEEWLKIDPLNYQSSQLSLW